MRDTVLSKAVIGQESFLRKAMMVLGGSMLIAVAAQVSVPFYPVPVTLQTLAVLIVGLTFGSRMGALAVLTYLAEGAAGLPVFANAGSAPALIGPTAGFLVGFVGMAYLAGLAVEKGLARGLVSTVIIGVGVTVLVYIPGAAWPMAIAGMTGISGSWVGSSANVVWTYFVAPFLIGDVIKAVIAAMVVSGGWAVVKARG